MFDETDYVSTLKGAIDNYLTTKGMLRQLSCTPGNDAQGVKAWLYSRPFDLINWLQNGNVLMLEVKIRENKAFRSPYPDQFKLNRALEECGQPIQYCFNLKDRFTRGTYDEYLTGSQCVVPSELYDEGGILQIDDDKTLQLHLDNLCSQSTTGGQVLEALWAKGTIKSVEDLTASTVLVVYTQKNSFFVETLADLLPTLNQLKKEISTNSAYPTQVEDFVSAVESKLNDMQKTAEVNNEPTNDSGSSSLTM